MVRNVQTTTTNGLRKNRITQKTRLRVVRGQLDEDPIILDDEEERNKVLASQGVDAEDANEHHLQEVLNAANRRKPAGTHGKHNIAEAHIPTPDAAGVVEAYESLYQSGKYKQPTTHLRFSETVEEIVEGGLAGGFTYFLDERDLEWIKKNNQEARGEGTSASASINAQSDDGSSAPTRSGRLQYGRSVRCKGKEPEQTCSADHVYPRIVVDEDEFELVMGLFEKLTEDKFPFIHLDLETFPPFSDYEVVFAAPLPPATFANYIAPSSVPPPERLALIARTVYPYWKQRKIEREGKRVVPQLDYDDTQESSYICFRRRDAKPVRRTRASSTAYTDKLTRLRAELQMGCDLARMVLEREGLKRQDVAASKDVWQARCALVEAWRSEGGIKRPDMGIDESLLYDKERVVKRPKLEVPGAQRRIVLGINRRSSGQPISATPTGDSHSPLTAHLELPGINLSSLSAHAYVAVQSAVRERYLDVQANVEKEMASLRARDAAWEDLVDMPVQSMPVPSPDKFFRPYSPPSSHSPAYSPPYIGVDSAAMLANGATNSPTLDSVHIPRRTVSPPALFASPLQSHQPSHDHSDQPPNLVDSLPTCVESSTKRHPHALRLRTGRGGRLHLDRRLHVRKPHPLLSAECAGWPLDNCLAKDRNAGEIEVEAGRWRKRDGCPGSFSDGDQSRGKTANALGHDYWAHESIYAGENAVVGKRKREVEAEEVFGFEQSAYMLEPTTYAEWEKGPVEEAGWRPEPRSRGMEPQCVPEEEMDEPLRIDGGTEDAMERAWRIDDQWLYDSDVRHDSEDRFLLDDFQPKFLRTMITLLDASDHEAIKTDAKHLAPPLIPSSGAKPFPPPIRLTDQERARIMTLKALRGPKPPPQSQPVAIPKLPQQAVPSTPPPMAPLPQQAASTTPGPEQVDEQMRRVVKQPQPAPSKSPVSPVPVTPQIARRASVTQQSPPTPSPSLTNGFHTRPIPLVNGISGDDGATVRVSSSMRPKVHTANMQQQQNALGLNANGYTNLQANGTFAAHQPQNQNHGVMHPGHAHGLNPQQYAALRNVFGAQQQQQQQHQQQHQMRPQMAMQMQMNGMPVNGNINLQMGPGNLNLKLPPSRPTQLRMNGNVGGDVNGVVMGGSPAHMHASPPRPNAGSPIPHTRTPSANGHLMAPNHGRASPVNMHLPGHAPPLGHANPPHHHPNFVALPLHGTTPTRPAPTLMHQQMVGAAGQGHEYS